MHTGKRGSGESDSLTLSLQIHNADEQPYLSSLQQKAHASFLSQNVGGPNTTLQPPDEIAGLPAGISVHASQSDKFKDRHNYQLPDARGTRFLALRHVNAYFSEVGEYIGHASGLVLGGPGGVSDVNSTNFSRCIKLIKGFQVDIANLYSPPVVGPIPDTPNFLNWPADSDEGSSSSSEQISQFQLQQSWSDFLSHL